MSGKEKTPGNVSSDLEKILNTHGFGFQYAVIKAARDLFDEQHCVRLTNRLDSSIQKFA